MWVMKGIKWRGGGGIGWQEGEISVESIETLKPKLLIPILVGWLMIHSRCPTQAPTMSQGVVPIPSVLKPTSDVSSAGLASLITSLASMRRLLAYCIVTKKAK